MPLTLSKGKHSQFSYKTKKGKRQEKRQTTKGKQEKQTKFTNFMCIYTYIHMYVYIYIYVCVWLIILKERIANESKTFKESL